MKRTWNLEYILKHPAMPLHNVMQIHNNQSKLNYFLLLHFSYEILIHEILPKIIYNVSVNY